MDDRGTLITIGVFAAPFVFAATYLWYPMFVGVVSLGILATVGALLAWMRRPRLPRATVVRRSTS